jgi:hypothetical protein
VLLTALPSSGIELAVFRAWRRTLRFFDDLYVDLHHFAVNLATAFNRPEVRNAAIAVQRAIAAKDGPIIAERHSGRRMAAARGLSIYFPPFRDPAAFYRDLDFAKATHWADFLDAFLGSAKSDAAH